MGLPMENDLLATTSEEIMESESKFGTQKNLLLLAFQSINIVLIDHVMSQDHFSKNLKIDKTGAGFKKRSQVVSYFSFILINFYHFPFGMTVHCISHKKTEQKHHFTKCPNLILIFKNFYFKLLMHSFQT